MRRILNGIMDIFFPRMCIVCDTVLDTDSEHYICHRCMDKVFIRYCNPDIPSERYFDEYVFVMPYYGYIKNALLNYKFHNYRSLKDTFAYLMAKRLSEEKFVSNCDMVIPVPISEMRHKERGYNQSALIAHIVAEKIGILYKDNVLLKSKDTPPISSMKASDRKKAVKGVYRVCGDVRGKNILLIDDIYTTGSTINECARVLKKAGAQNVYISGVCVALSHEDTELYEKKLDLAEKKRLF